MKYFWRKPAKTLIYLLTLFMTVGFFSVPVHATNDGDATNPGGSESGQPAENTGNGNTEGTTGQTDGGTGGGVVPGDTGIKPGKITTLLQTDAPSALVTYLDPDGTHVGELKIDAYKVAVAKKDNTYDTYTYEAVDGFEVSDVDLSTYDGLKQMDTAAKWDNFAQELTKIVKDNKPAGANPFSFTFGQPSEDLEHGLYLILAHGDMTDYFETEEVDDPTDPSHKTTKVVGTIFNTDTNSYSFRPILVAVPSTNQDTSQDMTTDQTPWVFDLNVYLKPSEKPLYGNLKIIKQLIVQENRIKNTPMIAVFKITGKDAEGTVVYRNVASITIPGDQDYVVLEHIPVGTVITVEERYDGSGYKKISGPTPDSVVIKKPTSPDADPATDPETVTVSFVDSYDGELKKGYGIMNIFTKDETGWSGRRADAGGDDR